MRTLRKGNTYFEKVNRELLDVKVTLVSMDIDQDPNPQKVYKFVARKDIKSQVLIIDEKNPRLWLKKIDKNWVRNIPVTLVVNSGNGKRKFIERQLKNGELEQLINEVR